MTVQRENTLAPAVEPEQQESTLEGTPVTPQPAPQPQPAPPTPVPSPSPKPPIRPQCCGQPPGPMMLVGNFDETEHLHDAECPNHPDNLAKQEVAS
ncbi:hypothetical protein ACWGE0_41465 [Lentzea sp. NPDC054927]